MPLPLTIMSRSKAIDAPITLKINVGLLLCGSLSASCGKRLPYKIKYDE